MVTTMVVLENLGKKFGMITAVDEFNLEVQEGEFITLLGPSGCGKTTALRMIAGQEMPTTGRIYIDGNEMNFVPAHRRPVNMVFQSYALFPHMTVYENIAFGPSLRKIPNEQIRKEVAEILDLVRLAGFEQRRVTQLSGGQSQRVALARALINKPKVLLLDEPLGALDLKLRKQMQLELKSLNRQIHTTFIYVTHDQEEALTMSDRIVVMNQGKIVQVGTAREIYEKPVSSFVSSFVGETNLLKGKVQQITSRSMEIDLEGFLLSVPLQENVRSGQIISISIRPDAIEINPSTDEESNVVSAQVNNIIFLGTIMKYELCLKNGCQIIAQTTQTNLEKVYHTDEQVQVRLPIEKMVILTA